MSFRVVGCKYSAPNAGNIPGAMPASSQFHPGQTEPVGKDGQRAKERYVLGDLVTGQVGVFTDNVAANRVLVFARQPSMIFNPARHGQ